MNVESTEIDILVKIAAIKRSLVNLGREQKSRATSIKWQPGYLNKTRDFPPYSFE